MNTTETAICRKLVKAAIDAGYTVSVDNHEYRPVKHSVKIKEILAELGQTDEDSLIFHRDGKNYAVHLVHGNDWAVISDYSCSLAPLVDPIIDWAASTLS